MNTLKEKTIMKNYGVIITIILIVAVYSPRLIAGEPLPISTFAFPPYNYLENGRVTGSEIEVVQKVFQRMGYELEVQLLAIGRALADTTEGRFVALVALSETPERFSTFYPSDPIGLTRPEIVKRKDMDFTLKMVDDYFPYLVGVTKGFHYTIPFEEAVAAGKIQVSELSGKDTELRHLRMLVNGRVDLVFTEANVINHIMNKHSPEFELLERVSTLSGIVFPHYVMFSKKWPNGDKLRDQFNTHLANLASEGELLAIWEKYNIVARLKGPQYKGKPGK